MRIIKAAIALVILLALASCAVMPDIPFVDNSPSEHSPDAMLASVVMPPDLFVLKVELDLADLGDNVSVLTDSQSSFISDGDYNRISDYASGVHEENSRPLPVTLTWTADYQKAPASVTYTVAVSESDDLKDALVMTTSDTSVAVFNLMPKTRYYWNVTATSGIKSAVSETASFMLADEAPRPIYVSGVTNCRDLGGWRTDDGNSIKYGMIYRTARLNENATETARITPAGIDMMVNRLGIKTEIDIRGHVNDRGILENGITESLLGDGVRYVFCPIEYGGGFDFDTDEVRRIFAVLADESNYPLFFHCSIGTDRTGMIAMMLEALLGVSEHDIYMDYVFSNFAAIGIGEKHRTVDHEASYLARLRTYGGATPREWARNYLRSIGVTDEEMDRIVEILTEK